MDENTIQIKFDMGNKKEYEVEWIWNSIIYTRESKCHLQGLYYLILWKSYLKEKNTWEPTSAMQHLQKLISTFHKDHPDKSIVISTPIDTALLMAKHLAIKQKRDQPVKASSTKKYAKESWIFWTSNVS